MNQEAKGEFAMVKGEKNPQLLQRDQLMKFWKVFEISICRELTQRDVFLTFWKLACFWDMTPPNKNIYLNLAMVIL